MATRQVLMMVAGPFRMVREENDSEFVQNIGVASASCGNPECSTGCHTVALHFGIPGGAQWSFRLEPEHAEALAEQMILKAAEQSAKLNPSRQ